jgi:glycosyltransferase involved in cell wall biosynthesis
MRVLLTHECFPPEFRGGGERLALTVATQLARRGVRVQVLTSGDPAVTSAGGIPTVRLPVHRYLFNLAVPQIARLARDCDVIQTFNYHACLPSLIAGRWLGKPVICCNLGMFGDAWKDMRGPVAGRAFIAWEKYLISRRFSRIVCLSEYSRESSVRLGMSRDRSVVYRIGVDLNEFAPAAEKDDAVLFVGKLSVRKGIHDVFAAASALPAVRFRVAGWGPDEVALRKTAPPNVEFLGWPGSRLNEVFAKARIFLLPSRAEGFPSALLQAMASGCAVVCTLPLEFDGIFVPGGNKPRLIEAVHHLWRHPDETAKMGDANRARAREYDWTRHVDQLLELYRQVLDEQRAAPAPNIRTGRSAADAG